MISEKTGEKVSLDRKIVRMTVPTVLSNISVPLLGLCDTAVAGHMDGERYLAGIAIGSVMITTMYWLFSFLRAGTSGITATCYGAEDRDGMGASLRNSVVLAIAIGLLLLCVHDPVLSLLQKVMGASSEVTELSGCYFKICIMGSVPMMALTALTGWMIGMQSTSAAMFVNIGMSVLNVASTLTLVYGFGLGFEGIAYGTLAAQWIILVPAFWLVVRLCRKNGVSFEYNRGLLLSRQGWLQMLNVNSNLFFRSACLIALTMMLYAYSARIGDVEVSSNAVINQLFLFFSYFMDGFAFTGEALVGRYSGAGDSVMLRRSILGLLKWTIGVTVVFSALYSFALPYIVRLLSDSAAVEASVGECRLWVTLLPVAGAGAFIYDGFYIGLTRTRPMLISTLCGVALFAVLLNTVSHTQWMLWMSFTSYLFLRSLLLITLFRHDAHHHQPTVNL
ncbi:MAG: MATE family efflux transporter [Muribaculaceae bacterium]|nr:MATE family efflux transporter [Muribaculaceae bacterium]